MGELLLLSQAGWLVVVGCWLLVIGMMRQWWFPQNM
jgi:hypothetical protein